jgi:predicted nuclease with TOPRIM domain
MSKEKSLVKNPATSEKEALLKQLQKERTSLLKKLEKQKTKLNSLKEEIISTQQRNFTDFTSRMDLIKQLQAELKELFTRVSKMKGISREEKKMMKEMAREVSENMFGDFDDLLGAASQDNSQKKAPSEFFTQFAPKPEAKEAQDIRKVFL